VPDSVPNREADLTRPFHDRKGGDAQSVTRGVARPTKVPNGDRSCHPIAKRLWDSLKESGQADFYQASDWALATPSVKTSPSTKGPESDQVRCSRLSVVP
jgi:hypothetical protein